MAIIRKEFSVGGFGNRFLIVTKAMQKKLLSSVDKLLIQHVAAEAIATGINTLILVMGRNKRAIEDQLDGNNELESRLRAKGKDAQQGSVKTVRLNGR